MNNKIFIPEGICYQNNTVGIFKQSLIVALQSLQVTSASTQFSDVLKVLDSLSKPVVDE